MISNSSPNMCKEYKFRYCDFEDEDIDLCYSYGNMYCCHGSNKDHYWNRRHEWNEREWCGGYDNCYRIVEENYYVPCGVSGLFIFGQIFYAVSVICLGVLIYLYR